MKIKKNDLMIALAVISYLKPANVLLWPRINYIYALLKIVATAWILLEFLKQKKGISRIAVECLLFLTIWAISIFRNNGTLGEYTQQIASIIGLLILFEVISTKERLKYLISVVSTLGKIYFVFELVTIFTNKPLFAEITEGYDRYFLGSDNYSAFIMIPVCGFIIVNSLIKHGRITASTWSFAIAGFFALAIPFSVTAMISYGLLLIVVFLTVHHFTLKMVDYKKIIAITVVFLILVVRFSVQNRLMWLLGKIGKVGLNSRDIIWPRTVSAVMRKPLFGYGALSEAQKNSYLLYGAGHAHNFVLEFFLETGVIGTFVAMNWLFHSLKGIEKENSLAMKIWKLTLACYCICGMFDFYLGLIYFWLFIFTISKYEHIYNKGKSIESTEFFQREVKV